MALKVTSWKPDTCPCVIHYEWDDALSEDDRTHNLNQIGSKCSDHAALSDQEVYDAIMHENPSKNIAMGLVMDNFPSLVKQVVDQDGNITNKFITGMEPVVNFDPVQLVDAATLQQTQQKLGAKTPGLSQPAQISARPIQLVTAGMSPQDIINCQQLMDDNLGTGVVTVS